ncbi:CMRF35-like molecule 3 [Anoplopoma fimbria]|uniref:CMRF35-like molecule 3 n=1 Tax=Anoplopoma fimbria TaxID=229290 RepID=UPI0023EBE6DF|nr:CMRF35-like molecule 3 [Anoplopoma fimbria]
MKTSLGLFNAPVLCLLWLTKHNVDSVQLSAPKVVTGALGGSVTIPCQYDRHYRDNSKYWCKGLIYELCEIIVRTPNRQRNDRSSIVDDKDAGVFTVIMTSLLESDNDKYWCVISRSGRNIFSGVKLSVSHTAATTTTTTTTTILEQNEIS